MGPQSKNVTSPKFSGEWAAAIRRRAGQRTYSRREKTLIGLEFGTGAAALAAGLLLTLRPDGSFLHADPHVLRRTPFADWRLPGLLLAAGCGGGYLAAGSLQLSRHPAARKVSMAAGTTLIVLEAWECAVIEYQPLEVVFAGVGAAVVVLAARGPEETPSSPQPRDPIRTGRTRSEAC